MSSLLFSMLVSLVGCEASGDVVDGGIGCGKCPAAAFLEDGADVADGDGWLGEVEDAAG